MQQKMYHVYDRPVIANYAVEYSDSYSIVTYTHLAQLSSVWASHSHLSMFQLVYEMEKKFVVNSIFNKWRTFVAENAYQAVAYSSCRMLCLSEYQDRDGHIDSDL